MEHLLVEKKTTLCLPWIQRYFGNKAMLGLREKDQSECKNQAEPQYISSVAESVYLSHNDKLSSMLEKVSE